jgi:hypothetical protein
MRAHLEVFGCKKMESASGETDRTPSILFFD